jgi:hypothetical protein
LPSRWLLENKWETVFSTKKGLDESRPFLWLGTSNFAYSTLMPTPFKWGGQKDFSQSFCQFIGDKSGG